MEEREGQYLDLLKKEIARTMNLSNPGISLDINEWKGQDIIDFQEDLLDKTKERISEKWFYTHMKRDNEKIPRIDVLNLLARYSGYKGWREFKNENQGAVDSFAEPRKNKRSGIYLKILGLLLVLIVSIILVKKLGYKKYDFEFFDAYTKQRIRNMAIEIIFLSEDESPLHRSSDTEGYFTLETKEKNTRFVLKAPYYKTDTITRVLRKLDNFERIYMYPNDYALMIHYFSSANVKDWQKWRNQLETMISDSAYICQVYDGEQTGIELYNKSEFLNKLTMPVSSLKNIEIIETVYTGGKISLLRFRQLPNE